DPYSTLAWVDASGQVTHLPASAFRLEPLARWRSPRSGADYPLGFRLHVPDPKTTETRVFDIVPLAKDQELPGSIGNVPYWEGACEVRNDRGEVVGTAFVELTGYAGNLSGTLR
ncbi:MAG: lipocalin family protein, partial [Verrucomicrobiales bacterium]|nr:lipocalin family protein [Verrucomicrobiales bacterium]